MNISSQFHSTETGEIQDISEERKEEMKKAIFHMADQALRTLGLAYKKVNFDELDTENKDERGIYEWEKSDFVLIGFVGIMDIIRPEVPKSVLQCKKAGIEVKMVTGDNKVTARAIARKVNIITPDIEKTALVMEGPEFYEMIGGVICGNHSDGSECDCVANEREKKLPSNKNKLIRKDTI